MVVEFFQHNEWSYWYYDGVRSANEALWAHMIQHREIIFRIACMIQTSKQEQASEDQVILELVFYV